MRFSIVTATIGVALVLSAENAYADVAEVAVLPTQTLDALSQGEGLTSALKRAVGSTPGYALADGDWSRPDVLIMGLGCGSDPDNPPSEPDAACEEKIANRLKVDRFVWSTLAKAGENVKGTVHFYQRGKPSGAGAPIEYTANLTSGADDTLLQIARAALKNAGGGAPPARLRVEIGTVMGDGFVDGEPVGKVLAGKGDFTATVGPHKVMVKLANGQSSSADVVVSADGQTKVTLAPPAPPAKPLDLKIPIGFTLLAAGAGVAVAGLVGTLNVRKEQNALNMYRHGQPKSYDACKDPNADAAVQSICKTGKNNLIQQAVAYPIAGALAITGAVLLGVSDLGKKSPKTTASFVVTPLVGPNAGFLSVEGQY
jgi:hypothetical protein